MSDDATDRAGEAPPTVLWEREVTSTSGVTSMGRYRIVRDGRLWAALQLQHDDGSWHDLESYDRFTGTAVLDMAAALAAERAAHQATRDTNRELHRRVQAAESAVAEELPLLRALYDGRGETIKQLKASREQQHQRADAAERRLEAANGLLRETVPTRCLRNGDDPSWTDSRACGECGVCRTAAHLRGEVPAAHTPSSASPLNLAIRFHEVYERLAPRFGYQTRSETRAFDPASPNGKLMTAVCAELLGEVPAQPTRQPAADDAVMHPDTLVVGPCIACAHILHYAAWDARCLEVGICATCLALTAPNRGGCSHTRGCDCTQDGVSWRIRDAQSADEPAPERSSPPATTARDDEETT